MTGTSAFHPPLYIIHDSSSAVGSQKAGRAICSVMISGKEVDESKHEEEKHIAFSIG